MERLLKKQPYRPESKLLAQPEDQNRSVDSVSQLSNRQTASIITAADHQLRKLAKRQQNLRDATPTPGAGHEKAQLLSNKTHYSPTDPDARISMKPATAARRQSAQT